MHFIEVNELNLTQVELFYFFHFMCVAPNASELFCMAYLANIERFLYHYNLSFQISSFIYMYTHQLEQMKIECEKVRFTHFREKTHPHALELIFVSSL